MASNNSTKDNCFSNHDYSLPLYGQAVNGAQPILGYLCRKCGEALNFKGKSK